MVTKNKMYIYVNILNKQLIISSHEQHLLTPQSRTVFMTLLNVVVQTVATL